MMEGTEELAKGIPIRSVSRAIRILQIINRLNNPTIMEIKQESKFPYPTVYRMIMTLLHEGLIECEPSRKRYRPTELVWSLVTGFQEEDLLVAKSREHLVRLTSDVHWPVAVSVRVGDRMIIKDSTHTLTTQTFNNYYPGYTLPILDSAAGRCFLAFSSDEERAMIFKSIAAQNSDDDKWSMEIASNVSALQTIQEQGFAAHARSTQISGTGTTAAIAVPIFVGDSLKACLTLVFFQSSMSIADASAKYASVLKNTSEQIGKSLFASDAELAGDATAN